MDHRSELIGVIHSVRNRWRLRLAMRGVVLVFAGTVLALLLSASELEALRFSATAIVLFRIVAIGIFLALVLTMLVRPLRRRVTDNQVAMYLEESNPQLESAIISATETSAAGESGTHSARLAEKLVEQAIDQCRQIDHRQATDSVAFRRHSAAPASAAL